MTSKLGVALGVKHKIEERVDEPKEDEIENVSKQSTAKCFTNIRVQPRNLRKELKESEHESSTESGQRNCHCNKFLSTLMSNLANRSVMRIQSGKRKN